MKLKNQFLNYFPDQTKLSVKEFNLKKELSKTCKLSETFQTFSNLYQYNTLSKAFLSLYFKDHPLDIIYDPKDGPELTIRNLIKAKIPEAYFHYKKIPGIEAKILTNIVNYFESEENIELINRLKKAGLNFKIEKNLFDNQKTLNGYSIVVSGVFKYFSRDEYKSLIDKYGGKNTPSVTANTTFILAGENMGPKKMETANLLNIKIVTEEEFLEMLGIKNTPNDNT